MPQMERGDEGRSGEEAEEGGKERNLASEEEVGRMGPEVALGPSDAGLLL